MKSLNPKAIITFHNVTKKFGSFKAISNFSLEIKEGEILGFCGPNGAGKTTIMKMLAGLIRPTSGEIYIQMNKQIISKELYRDRIGFLVESPKFYEHMSPRIILSYFAKIQGIPRKKITQRVEDVVKMIGMTEWIDKPISTFSNGMKQKIGILAAIVHDPLIIVLDEPQSGLDPKTKQEMRDFFLSLKALGKTVFISSHLLYEISEIADRIAIISQGVLVACDKLENLEIITKRSTIEIEILHNDVFKSPEAIIQEFEHKIAPLIDLTKNTATDSSCMNYNAVQQKFEINFDGNKKTQNNILKVLMDGGLEIVNFSVPKTSSLEKIYLQLMLPADIATKKVQIKNILS